MIGRRTARWSRSLFALAFVAAFIAAPAGAASAKGATAPPTAAASRAAATSYAATIHDGRAAALALAERPGVSSLSLALAKNGRVVWSQGFGYADRATLTAPTSATMFGIGSVSKMLATVAAMQLVDRGLISLDEPFATYVPSFTMLSPGYRQITVRMLLDHSSGFPGSVYDNALTPEFWPGYLSQVLDTLAQSRLKHTPGFLSTYCNDGFTMVEALVPAVTGKSFAQYVQDEIFAPLGMTHSSYPLEPFAEGSYARTYDGDTVLPREVLNVLASGGAYSTPTDMSKFATMLMNGGMYEGRRVLSAESIAEMSQDQTLRSFDPAPSGSLRYGLGWDSVAEPGLATVGVPAWVKGGDSTEYHTGFTVAPKAKLAVTVTGAGLLSSGDCESLCQRILLHALVDQGTLRRLPAKIRAAAPPLKRATSAQLAAVEGFYAGNGLVAKVVGAADDPQKVSLLSLAGDAWSPVVAGLRMRSDGGYHVDGSPASVRTVTGAGRRYLMSRKVAGYGHYFDDLLLFQKVQPGAPLSAAWQGRVGHAWLGVTGRPDSADYASGPPVLQIGDVPGLPGYVTVATSGYGLQAVDPSESDGAALTFLQIPGFGSRDIWDVNVVRQGGEDWMRYAATLYRPLDSVPELAAGPQAVAIGSDGYAEWRRLPAAAQLTIGAGTAWHLYGAEMNVLDGGSTFPATDTAPAGAYLLLFAPAGTSPTVTVTPANADRAAWHAGAAGQHRAAALHFTLPVRRAVVGPQLQDIASVLR